MKSYTNETNRNAENIIRLYFPRLPSVKAIPNVLFIPMPILKLIMVVTIVTKETITEANPIAYAPAIFAAMIQNKKARTAGNTAEGRVKDVFTNFIFN